MKDHLITRHPTYYFSAFGGTIKFGALKELSIKAFCFSVLSEFLCVGEAE